LDTAWEGIRDCGPIELRGPMQMTLYSRPEFLFGRPVRLIAVLVMALST